MFKLSRPVLSMVDGRPDPLPPAMAQGLDPQDRRLERHGPIARPPATPGPEARSPERSDDRSPGGGPVRPGLYRRPPSGPSRPPKHPSIRPDASLPRGTGVPPLGHSGGHGAPRR